MGFSKSYSPKTDRKDIVWLLLLFFVFMHPILNFYSSRILVFLFVLVFFLRLRKFDFSHFAKSSWDKLFYILVIVVGLTYSSDLCMGLKTLETSFAVFALPFIFSWIVVLDRNHVNEILLAFSLGIFTAGSVCLMKAVFEYSTGGYDTSVFFFYDFTKIINSHPTYFAYYLIFAITYGLYLLNYEKHQFPAAAAVGFVLFCFCILLLTGGQTAFIAILFVFAFFILKFFLGQNDYRHKVTFALVSLLLVVILFVNSAVFPQRSQELTDSWERFELWRSAILANSDPIFGVGTGDSKSELKEYFLKTRQDQFAAEELNAHNQFLQILFSNGVFGLLSLTVLMLRPLYLAFKNNDQMGILMIFPFLIYGITEVFLGRYQGVVFFALLHQVFVSHYLFLKNSSQPATTFS